MLKKLFLCLYLYLTFITNAIALSFTEKNELVNLTVTPEYQSISKETSDIGLIATIDIKTGWHIYWQNPGDTGDPTTLTYYDSPYYTESERAHTTPQKSVFNDIITTYIYRQKVYFKSEFKLHNLENQTTLPFNAVLSYTICKKECLPGTININFALPIADTNTINPIYQQTLSDAEKTFPLPLDVRAKFQNEFLKLKLNNNIAHECSKPEFISYHKKKNIISNLPQTNLNPNGHIDIIFDKGETPPDAEGILLCDNTAYHIAPKHITPSTPSSAAPSSGFIYYLITAFLAGLILNLMPCVLPIISLKALYLAAHKEKASPISALIYLAGVLSSFLALSGLLFYLREYGTELGWGFQLQSPAFNIFLMLLFFLIFLNLIDRLQIPDIFADKLSKIAGNKSFLTGFFAVIIACPCTGPFMGAALGYALQQPPLIYFTIFLSLGFGYALPYVLIETFPSLCLKFIPAPGPWMIRLKKILALPIALTCLWLGWIIYNQLTIHNSTQDILWEEYSKEKVTQSLNNNEAVLIDFTARWCLVCLLNDKAVLDTQSFKELVKTKHLKLYKADWTNRSSDIADALKSYGRNSIPLYVYYAKGSKTPQYLPQILTPNILTNILK